MLANTEHRSKLLVRSPHCTITRGSLRTLQSRKSVVNDMLILLACMLAGNSTRIHWFLPTTFSQIATGRGPIPHATLKAIREDFMGKANRAIFMEEALDSDDWYDDSTNPRILCSDYEIIEPKVSRQDPRRYPYTPSTSAGANS
ncbi:uncharacterized protein DS421_6g186470 [Arachis hypogaea]|nr:uncharacterized protein DS421_6g186470 [Arachis hypogaea]